MTQRVSSHDRFVQSRRCPICQGWQEGNPDCKGYRSDNPNYIYCGSSAWGGNLERDEWGNRCHYIGPGICKCGNAHYQATGNVIEFNQKREPKVTATQTPPKPQAVIDAEDLLEDIPGWEGGPAPEGWKGKWEPTWRLDDIYHYQHFEVVRILTGQRYVVSGKYKKTNRQRRKLENGEYAHDVPPSLVTLYQVERLRKAKAGLPVIIAEGEPKVKALIQLGFLAVCNPMGAGPNKWRDEFNRDLVGRKVFIWPDNDPPGYEHAARIEASLKRSGIAAYTLVGLAQTLPPKGDVIQYLEAGGTKEKLELALKHAEKISDPFNRVETFDAEELMGEVFKPIKWTVPGLLPEGATIAAARPKIGKSWMMLELSMAVASGGRFMGMFECEQGEVLYCALEDNKRRLQERLKLLLNGEKPPKGLHFLLNIPKIGEGFIDWMKLWLEKHPDTRLIIIDTLSKIKPVKGKDETLYEADYKAGEGIKNLTDNYRFSCVMVYHTRKQEAEDPLEKVSGSYGLTGGIDNVWVIDRKTAEADGKLSITGRDIEEQDLAVSFSKETFRWVCKGDATMFSENQSREEIFALFRKSNNKPLTASEVCRALGKGPKEYDGVRKLLHRMDGQGLSEDARGYFKLTRYTPPDPDQIRYGF